jgi:hypothetical protein
MDETTIRAFLAGEIGKHGDQIIEIDLTHSFDEFMRPNRSYTVLIRWCDQPFDIDAIMAAMMARCSDYATRMPNTTHFHTIRVQRRDGGRSHTNLASKLITNAAARA